MVGTMHVCMYACIPFEVGSRGHISKKIKTDLINILARYCVKVPKKQLNDDFCKISREYYLLEVDIENLSYLVRLTKNS